MVELLCRRLRHRFDMQLLSDGSGDLPNRLEDLGVEVIALPIATKGSFALSIPRLARAVRKLRPDVVHLYGQFAGSFGQIGVRMATDAPTIYNVQWPSYLSDRGPYTRIRNWSAEWLSCALATRVVALAEHDRRVLVDRRMCSPGKLSVIHNSHRLAVADLEPREANDALRLVFVGRVVDQKGLEHAIAALPLISAAEPGVTLTIVGEGERLAPALQLAETLGVGHLVLAVGYQRDPVQYIRDADIVVVPSIYEPFGIVAVEAMALGRPVVASGVGGLSEVVDDGHTGRLVPPADPRALASAVLNIWQRADRGAGMGRAGQKRAEQKFSPAACADAFAELYSELGSGPRTASQRRAATQ